VPGKAIALVALEDQFNAEFGLPDLARQTIICRTDWKPELPGRHNFRSAATDKRLPDWRIYARFSAEKSVNESNKGSTRREKCSAWVGTHAIPTQFLHSAFM
jgi:hypothetical protein